ncbi:SAC3/GANP/Nin1/mts3/eIF-3 p25 family-domain-containing protein [Aspergillus oleicola]
MASPANPFAALHQAQADGAASSTGRGRGSPFRGASSSQPRGGSSSAPFRGRGRGRGAPGAARAGRGNTRGVGAAGNIWRTNKAEQQAGTTAALTTSSPFAQLKQGPPSASPGAAPAPQQKPAFTGFGRGSSTSFGTPSTRGGTGNARGGSRGFPSGKPTNGVAGSSVPVEDASAIGSYNDRYEQLKIDRAKQREQAIKAGQMADPNQPMSLNKAITPVGTCTSMCPEFERVERIVQKMVDKSEKHLHPATNSLQNMEAKMLKRFRRSAAGYDEQLPSDIRTPGTLLQSVNYLTRHVIGGPEPLGIIHKFVWDRTRSIRNDFSVQQVTQEEDVKIAVTCLERIARFHIVSLHLLSSPANEEPFDRHQEREQLNNTMLSLMYYYDDNRGRILFPNEDEFRAYYIIFSIHDQRPDLEARVQKWPTELRNAPRVRVALELFAAAGNTWEYQGTLDAKRPNAIAQGFYTRFFSLINSPGVSYLMACVAEIYFNHMRQTAIRSIWKGYCRYPASQQHKNEEWTVDELTNVLCFDDDEQTIKFCEEQDLEFAENANGDLYLNWGSRPVDSVAFQPSSDHSFSEHYVEAKRAGRNLVAIILGLNVKEAAALGMIDRSSLSERGSDIAPVQLMATDNDSSLFVSEDENEVSTPASRSSTGTAGVTSGPFGAGATPAFGGISQPANGAVQSPFSQKLDDAQAQSQQPAAPNPFGSLFTAKNTTEDPAAPSSPSLNPFAKPFSPSSSSQASESGQPTTAFPAPAAPANNAQPSSVFANAGGFAKPSSPFPSSQTPGPAQPTITPSIFTNNAQRSSVFSNASHFTQQSQNKEDSASSAASPFKFPAVSQPLSSQTPPPSLFQNIQQPTPTTSPFSAPQSSSSFSLNPTQPRDQPTGQPSTSIFDLNKPSPAPETKAPLFSLKPQEPAFQQDQSSSFGAPQPQPATASPPMFSSPFAPEREKKEASSIFAAPASPRPAHREAPPIPPIPQPDVEQFSADQAETTITTQPLVPSEAEAETPSESMIEIQPAPNEAEEPTVAISEEQVSKEAEEAEAEAKKAEWMHWLREAADKRRSTVSTPASRKRVHEQETPPSDKIMEVPEVPKSAQPPPRKSMAAASLKPLPKLPILEQIERMTARKSVAQSSPEPPKPTHVDEDDLLLSAARIAAESLRTGPRITSSSSAPYEPWRSSFSPGSSVGSSTGTGAGAAFSHSESPQQSYISGYDVSLAPDTDVGLGRSLSRTEQRIRLTGGKGLAYKPLNLNLVSTSPRDSWSGSTPSKRRKAT